jgi:hypothetical protein
MPTRESLPKACLLKNDRRPGVRPSSPWRSGNKVTKDGHTMRTAKQTPLKESSVYAMTIAEASSAARIGVNSLMKFVRKGDLSAKKVGTRTLILPDDLRDFLANLPSYEPLHVIKARNAAAEAAGAPLVADLDLPRASKPTHRRSVHGPGAHVEDGFDELLDDE